MPLPLETLGDRLAATRHARFVGREAELDQFAGALAAEVLPFHVAFVTGPGGIGKTALLDEIAQLADAAGATVARIDGRDVEPSPSAFEVAAANALGASAAGEERRRVLFVDTYEHVEALDGWLRRSFVPSLRATDLVVIAGRHAPAAEWRAGWAGEVAVLPLRNLAPDEAAAYLTACDVPAGAHARVLDVTYGHPLALTLVAEHVRQHGVASDFDLTDAPDVLGDLLARFASAVPTPDHRAALEAAAVARAVTVPLLATLVSGAGDGAPPPSPERLFAWIRGLGFTEADAHGVRLHDVVRETVEADLRWRDPERHMGLHVGARRAAADHLRRATTDAEHHRALGDFLHLYRHHALVRPLLGRLRAAWAEADIAGSSPATPEDAESIRALVALHHDEAEADAVAGWIARRPGAAEVFRTRDEAVAGFLLTLPLDALDEDEQSADPVVTQVARAAPSLRSGERALLFRSWLDAEAGQGVSVVQSLVFARTVERYLATPNLAASILLTTQPELWGPIFAFVGLSRWPAAENAGVAAFGKDWRATPPDAWLSRLAEAGPQSAPPPSPSDTVVVLNEEAFAEAVRDALKALAQPRQLIESPLLRSRLVRECDGEPVEALRDLLVDAVRELDRPGKDQRFFRALDLTYLRPAPTQAIAAERLDVPFSTYRRHLRRGVDLVVESLWRIETGG